MAAPYNPPKKNEDFLIRISLEDMASPGSFKSSPTIAAGDFKVDKDAGGLTNLSTLPSVSPAASVLVLITLSATEMNADVVTLVGIDQTSPKEWGDFVLCIQTTQDENVTVGSIVAGAITAAAIADAAIDNATFAADVGSTAIATNVIGIASKKGTVDALNVDTYAEPGQEAPPATTTLVKKIGYLYKAFRNRITQTSTTLKLFADDAATVDQKATVSDDATTYDRSELTSGP